MWKGGREDANNAPVQFEQLLHRTGLANQDKVQTGRQTSQVSVTHSGEEGRKDGWQQAGEATGETDQRDEREGGRPAANDRGWRRWWTEGREGRGQGEWRRAMGLETRRSVSLPRDRGHVIGHTWPW